MFLVVLSSPGRLVAADEDLAPPPVPPSEDLAPPPAPPDEELAPPPDQKAPAPKDWGAWGGVTELRGIHTVSSTFNMSKDNGVMRETRRHLMDAELRFRLVARETASPFDRSFDPADGQIIGRDDAGTHKKDWSYEFVSSVTGNFSGTVKDISFTYSLRAGKWQFTTGGNLVEPYVLTTAMKTHALKEGKWRDETETQTRNTTTYRHSGLSGTLPAAKPTPLVARREVPYVNKENGVTELLVSTLVLVPVYEDAEVEFEIEGTGRAGKSTYEKWIPAGTLTGQAGAQLKVTARAKSPKGGKPKFGVKEFIFRLNGTSREPGYCLNFPLNAAPKGGKRASPDLRFMQEGGGNDPEFQEKRQPSASDPEGLPSATARIECFDWGAWSDLTVTAILDDGREVAGHLKGDASAVLVPLPKHGASSHIADAWKQDRQTSAADDDDSEKIPVGGKADGDGFTLYEEYRGFAEDGRHIEGDPQRIDFFVRNLVGGDARPGIDLFAALTGAVVHQKLQAAEFSREQRLMNGNHAQGAHRVDQHGVQLRTSAGRDGAAAVFSRKGVRGRPGLCIGIDVQPREAATSVTTSENVPASDLASAYDRAILHELLHTVGVEHHGSGDGEILCRYVFADDKRNITGHGEFREMLTLGVGDLITITDEESRRDLARAMEGDMMLDRERLRTIFYDSYLQAERARQAQSPDIKYDFTPEEDAEKQLNKAVQSFGWYVGAEHGQCSGDELCAMRYYFADLYEKKGASHAFYLIPGKATERARSALCTSARGTGINDSARKPQPRYGDAKAGCGNCASWIVFSDAIPPDPEP